LGEHARARAMCEKLLSFASPLELYAEQLDPKSGRHLGNFPQAFTHLALINAVLHVIRAEDATRAPLSPWARPFADADAEPDADAGAEPDAEPDADPEASAGGPA
jgi:hypothetical protein